MSASRNHAGDTLTKFFIPAAESAEQAQEIYEAISKFNNLAVADEQRIESVTWQAEGKTVECIVGKPFPASHEAGHEPIMAILQSGVSFLVCSASRGGLWGKPVVVGPEKQATATYFE
jgi:hypothetical protein